MSNDKKTDPEQLKPLPGMPDRFRKPLQPPLRPRTDETALRIAELEHDKARLQAETAKAEAELAFALKAKAELENQTKIEVESKSVSPRSKNGDFGVYIRDWKGAKDFVIAMTALGALVFGFINSRTKAPVPDVTKVEKSVANVEMQLSGKTDLKGAVSEGEDLTSKVKKQARLLQPLVDADCPRAQWMQAVLAQMKPPVIVELPKECKSSKLKVQFTEEQPLRGQKYGAIRVDTPMPSASASE